ASAQNQSNCEGSPCSAHFPICSTSYPLMKNNGPSSISISPNLGDLYVPFLLRIIPMKGRSIQHSLVFHQFCTFLFRVEKFFHRYSLVSCYECPRCSVPHV